MKLLVSFLVFLGFISNNLMAGGLKDSVDYLASDKLEGRKPGQRGNELATTYLVNAFKDSGLDPFAGSYKQDFTIFTQMNKTNLNELIIDNLKVEFEPISYSLNSSLENTELVFAGFGISIPKNDTNLKYDDYKGVDVKDKIVIIFTGDPGVGNINSQFRKTEYQNYSSLFYKLKNAILHGAKGVVLIQNPISLGTNQETIFFNNTEGGGSRFSVVAGKMTNKSFNQFLNNETSLSIQKKIAKTQKPASFHLTKKAKMSVSLEKKTGRVSNIVAFKKGKINKTIVIGAHMDHLGFGGDSSLDAVKEGKIHNGADDNASGTAFVSEFSNSIKDIQTNYNYVFVLFNAEEMGLLGSKYFVDMWTRHQKQYGPLIAMLNFDMIGRYKDSLSIMGVGTSLSWKSLLRPVSDLKYLLKDSSMESSDHAPFIHKKIPALFFTTGAHEDYHRSSDTSEKINIKAMEKLLVDAKSFVLNIDKTQNIVFNPDYKTGVENGRNRGYGAHLGCIPKFGQDESIKGVLCTGSVVNSPAENAGIINGDILVKLGSIEIKDIYDLVLALKYYRAGDEVELVWSRSSTLHKQKVILKKSKR